MPLEVRQSGKDAIRVCAIYKTKDGNVRGLIKETRTHRTGNIEDIVGRMYQRMRDAYSAASTGEKCYRCGAPKFVAKSGKSVCAEICWKSNEQKRADEISYKSKSRRKGRSTNWSRAKLNR